MWLLFILPGRKVETAYCEKPSLNAIQMASMVFTEKPQMLKDRFAIAHAEEHSRFTSRALDANIKKWLEIK